MSDRSIDGHKTPRVYKSGFDKLQEKKEKEKKFEKLKAQTRRMTDFLSTKLTNVRVTLESPAATTNEIFEENVC